MEGRGGGGSYLVPLYLGHGDEEEDGGEGEYDGRGNQQGSPPHLYLSLSLLGQLIIDPVILTNLGITHY